MANWISYPSFETPGGTAMTPALQIRISSWFPDFSRTSFAVWETELSEVWSQGMKVMLLEADLHAVMTASAVSVLRPVKYTCFGLCFASSRTVSFPTPAVPDRVSVRRS